MCVCVCKMIRSHFSVIGCCVENVWKGWSVAKEDTFILLCFLYFWRFDIWGLPSRVVAPPRPANSQGWEQLTWEQHIT